MTDKTEKGGEQRVCEVCHERKTIQPSSPYCAVCLAKHAKKPKEPKREALEAEKPRSEPWTIAKSLHLVAI